ncbi:UvrD-helicase domain-containing protein [Nocardioides insulae]|uniref:UvrD-helicase domain-containing protein n=1 Tax=Nocardioides insulae TaxID=394734 RepID=UPI00040392D7|nr:UvrD-helicase domain-containing protein [Nocardioides insulae]
MTDPAPFDLTGDLPTGTTLLEAGAGTGKTFTVAALVTRYVAEGVATLDELLVITFSRAATQELRSRVRAQLVQAERVLADAVAGGASSGESTDNNLLRHLLAASPDELSQRRRRLRDALAAFDGATIATIHQFCQVVLRSLGVASESDTSATLVESLDELVTEVVDDLYLARFGREEERPPFDREAALTLGKESIEHQNVALADPDPDDALARARVGFARDVRAEVERRKQRLGIQSYDDLLARLARALEAPDAPARARMRQRWRIVLVDEFQDTDPVQWSVFERAFHGASTLVLIGDPKQAIYGFRGGDVDTYLDAAGVAGQRATLVVNRRADADLVARLNVVLGGAGLGSSEIIAHPASAFHEGTRLHGAPHTAPFRVRAVRRDAPGVGATGRDGLLRASPTRSWIARDVAADIAELLGSGATWSGEEIRPEHVAVLISSRYQGEDVERQLRALGVPAVLNGGGDVFATPAADEWLALLKALEAPHRSPLVRAVAVGCFVGHPVADLAARGDEVESEVADLLRDWALQVRRTGVAALVEAFETRQLTERLLRREEGERLLTDIRHLGQILHGHASRGGLGLTALLEWFRDERRRTAAGERPLRLDSDAAAVQIMTIHGSKGLQFPVVYAPFLYEEYQRPISVARFHDRSHGRLRRLLDVSGSGRSWSASVAAYRHEEAGEDLRKLYVALTRAQSQVVVWWAPTTNTPTGPLNRLVFGRLPGDRDVPDDILVRDDDATASILTRLERDYSGPAAELAAPVQATVVPPPSAGPELSVRRFDRSVDTGWRRTSYSGLVRVEEQTVVISEPESTGKDDEPFEEDAAAAVIEQPEDPGVRSPMADLPAGATFGSLVHAVLEHTDPSDLEAQLRRHVAEQLRWWPVPAEAADLAEALDPLHHTPLGPLADELTLAQIPLTDRLRELDFEIPLAGGDAARGEPRRWPGDEVRLRDLGPLLRRHLPADDPLADYADRLETPVLGDQPLRGYLSGSVDVVLRVPGAEGERFVVVDYKTNNLGEHALDYRPDALAEAMLHSHYPLQAMLYSVVAHRYLRWRLPGYEPARHLGGVLYLYLRGMCGPETPRVDGQPTGVFSWRPPAGFVVDLSDLLDGLHPDQPEPAEEMAR